MRVLAVFLFVLLAMSLISFIVILTSDEDAKLSGGYEFKTFTSAVCRDSGEFVVCEDQLFVNCSGKISPANGSSECNGFIVDNKVSGFAVFEKSRERS